MVHLCKYLSVIGIITGLAGFSVISAHAQMPNNPWGFQQQNRASIASLIRTVEKEKTNSAAAAVTQLSTSSTYTNLVCGSDGQASAKGNSTCVIMNNASGLLDVGQTADGNQSAATSTSTNSKAEDVLQTLQGQATQ
ncbi:MAG: hypothetical protein ACOYK8_03035 [Alphaproteobacteria bacterium]